MVPKGLGTKKYLSFPKGIGSKRGLEITENRELMDRRCDSEIYCSGFSGGVD